MSNSGSTSKGHHHSLHEGLSSNAPSQMDSSRRINSSRSVNEGATREGVAVGTGTSKDGGKLK